MPYRPVPQSDRALGRDYRPGIAAFCLFLGRTSYSIYMVHFFIAFAFANVLKVVAKLLHAPAVVPGTDLATIKGSPFIMDGVTVLYLVTIVTVARFAYRLVERPGMELGARLASRVRRVPVAA